MVSEFSDVSAGDVASVMDAIGCGTRLAKELLVTAGGDLGLVVEAAKLGGEISMTKAYILDARFNKDKA